jgi:hypothetical protein
VEEFGSNFSSRLTASMSAAPRPYSVLTTRPMFSILSRSEFMVQVRLHSFCSRVSRRLNSVPVIQRRTSDARHFRQGRRTSSVGRVSGDARPAAHRVSRLVRSKFLRIRHIRKVERLASFRQRDPSIPQACIMFPLLRAVCFLRQRCALGGRFPCGLTFGSHLVVSNVGPSDGTPEVVCMRHPAAHIPVRRVVVTRFDR